MTSSSVCAHASFGVFAIAASSDRGRADSLESDASVDLPCSEERMRGLCKAANRIVTPANFAAVGRGG